MEQSALHEAEGKEGRGKENNMNSGGKITKMWEREGGGAFAKKGESMKNAKRISGGRAK